MAGNFAATGEIVKAVQIMRSVKNIEHLYAHNKGWTTNKKSDELVAVIFENSGITGEINDKNGKIISLEEAIALAVS